MTQYREPRVVRTATHPNGTSKTEWVQYYGDTPHYIIKHFEKQRKGRDVVWVLRDSVRREGTAPAEPKAKAVVAKDVSVSAETAPPGREEPWRERQRADEDAYWDRKTRLGET